MKHLSVFCILISLFSTLPAYPGAKKRGHLSSPKSSTRGQASRFVVDGPSVRTISPIPALPGTATSPLETQNQDLRESEAPSLHLKQTKIDPLQGNRALELLVEDLIENIQSFKCMPERTLVAFDLDDTVLRSEPDRTFAIRRSPEILEMIQKVGIHTLAVTARLAISESLAKLLKVNPNLFHQVDPSSHVLYSLKNFHITSEQLRMNELFFGLGSQIFEGGTDQFFDSRGHKTTQGYFWENGNLKLSQKDIRNPARIQRLQYYSNGILMTAAQNKGIALHQLLQKKGLENYFQCLFFADDDAEYLRGVEVEFAKLPSIRVFLYRMPHKDYQAW